MGKLFRRMIGKVRNIDDFAIAKITKLAIDKAADEVIRGAQQIDITFQLGVGIKVTLKHCNNRTLLRLYEIRNNLPTDRKSFKSMLITQLVDNNDEVTVFFAPLGLATISATYNIYRLYSCFDEITESSNGVHASEQQRVRNMGRGKGSSS